MIITWFKIRKSMVPDKEPKGWHGYRKYSNGGFQISYNTWFFYTYKFDLLKWRKI